MVAIEADGAAQFAWVSDGFAVAVGGPADEVDDGVGFEALSTAVDAVEAELGQG